MTTHDISSRYTKSVPFGKYVIYWENEPLALVRVYKKQPGYFKVVKSFDSSWKNRESELEAIDTLQSCCIFVPATELGKLLYE